MNINFLEKLIKLIINDVIKKKKLSNIPYSKNYN